MIGTWLFTFFKGKQVGSDYYGNRYFIERGSKKIAPRRWVIYKGDNEASKVVPEWNRWLHYACDELPAENDNAKPWQKAHVPNLTGTPKAYNPAKKLENKDGKYYSSWSPK